MDLALLRANLGDDINLRFYSSTASTMREAKAWAMAGAPPFSLVVAGEQQEGRGRLGKRFFSPPGGLYMSLVLPPQAQPGQLTTLAAVAVVEAVQTVCGIDLHIKWINDLLLEGRKVCGILAEGLAGDRGLSHVVLGIGVNTFAHAFPPELEAIAGHLPCENPEMLAAAIIHGIQKGLPDIPHHMPRYRARCITLGREVVFTREGRQMHGMATAVGDDGALCVVTPQGTVQLIAGEASVRGTDLGCR